MAELFVRYMPEFVGDNIELFQCDPIHAGKQVYITGLRKSFVIGADGRTSTEVFGALQPAELPSSGTAPVPLIVLAGATYSVAENTQQVFRKKIRCQDGARIKLDDRRA